MHLQSAILLAGASLLALSGTSDAQQSLRGGRSLQGRRTPRPTVPETLAPTAAPTAAPTSAPTAAPTAAIGGGGGGGGVGPIPDGALVITNAEPFTGDNPTNTIPGTVMAANFVTYVDLPDTFPPPADSGPVAGVQYLAFIKSGEWATYKLDVSEAGSYAVTYWFNGDPPAPSVAKVHLTLTGDCSAEPQLALLNIDNFDPGQYATHEPFPAGTPIDLPAGPVEVTLCFDDVTALNMGQTQYDLVV